jgi:hypothetical protein
VRAARTPTALYGTDPTHHIHVTERGDPKFIGFAWAVINEDDLSTISKLPDASDIENIDEPGGVNEFDSANRTATRSTFSRRKRSCGHNGEHGHPRSSEIT